MCLSSESLTRADATAYCETDRYTYSTLPGIGALRKGNLAGNLSGLAKPQRIPHSIRTTSPRLKGFYISFQCSYTSVQALNVFYVARLGECKYSFNLA